MRKWIYGWGLIFLLLLLPQIPLLAAESHWAEKTLQNALQKGILPNLTPQTDPDRPITRAEFVSMLIHGHELTASSAGTKTFIDCDASDWFYRDVMTAQALGIASGYPDGSFRPDDSITRQDAVILLLAAFNVRQIASQDVLQKFYDREEVSSYALHAASYAVQQGYLSGYWDGMLRPRASITIAEALTMDEKALQIKRPAVGGAVSVLEIENISLLNESLKQYKVAYQVDRAASLYYIVKYDGSVPHLGEMDLLLPWTEAAAHTSEAGEFKAEGYGETAMLWLLAVDHNGNYIWGSAVFPLTQSPFAGGDGTVGNPFIIAKMTDLKKIAAADYLGYHYRLQEDIILTSSWMPIGTLELPFTGSFDGNGKMIRGLGINTSNVYAGLFGYVDGVSAEQPAVIRNVCLVVDAVSGSQYAGGIAGYIGANAEVSSCAVMANESQGYAATIYAFGRNARVGGLAGQNAGSITNSYFNGVVTGVSTHTEVSVGGVVGDNTGSIQNVYSTAAVTGVASRGNVYVGGVAGKARGAITNSLGINQSVSGSGLSVRSGKIIGSDEGVNLLNCFGLADNRDLFLNDPVNGIPISSFETLSFDLYGAAGLQWDISEYAGDGKIWTLNLEADYPLPILTGGSAAMQGNQPVPDYLWY